MVKGGVVGDVALDEVSVQAVVGGTGGVTVQRAVVAVTLGTAG